MLDSQGDASLQMITASEFLTQAIQISPPTLIIQIESAATIRTIKAALQAQLPVDYPVTLLADLNHSTPAKSQVALDLIETKEGLSYPIHLYLPTKVSRGRGCHPAAHRHRCSLTITRRRLPLGFRADASNLNSLYCGRGLRDH